MVNAQEWLDKKYSNKEEVTEINSNKEGSEREFLEGELVLEDFPKLEKIDLSGSKGITKLTIINCPNVYYINVNDNSISEIVGHEELKELQWLWVSDNKITDPDIVAKNERLFIFACVRNPIKGGEINGRVLNKLIFFGGGIGEEKPIFYSVEKDHGEKMNEVNQNLLKVVDENNKKQNQLTEVKGEVEKLREELKNNNNQNDQKTIDKLQGRIKELEDKVKSLEDELELAKSGQGPLKGQQGLITINKALQKEIADLKKEIEQLKAQNQVEVPPKGKGG